MQTILPILEEAAEAILAIYHQEIPADISIKPDASPVTAADMASHAIIMKRLMGIFPDIPVISEESKYADYSIRKAYKQFFLLDPLDGTKEFIRKNGEFTINLGLIEDGRPVFGAVYIPVDQVAYFGYRGQGSYKLEGKTETPIHSQPFSLGDEGLRVVASRSHLDEETIRIISKLSAPEILPAGSALKFVRIAEGKADLYPRMGPTMEWDTAAAQCVLEAAGGFVARYPEHTPLGYNKESLLNPNFIAAGRLLDPEKMDLLFSY